MGPAKKKGVGSTSMPTLSRLLFFNFHMAHLRWQGSFGESLVFQPRSCSVGQKGLEVNLISDSLPLFPAESGLVSEALRSAFVPASLGCCIIPVPLWSVKWTLGGVCIEDCMLKRHEGFWIHLIERGILLHPVAQIHKQDRKAIGAIVMSHDV